MLACIHTKWASLFSRVVIFAGGNFRIFSRRENYNSAKINVHKVYNDLVNSYQLNLSLIMVVVVVLRHFLEPRVGKSDPSHAVPANIVKTYEKHHQDL